MKQDYEILVAMAEDVESKAGCKVSLHQYIDDDLACKFSSVLGRHVADVIIVFEKPISEFDAEEKKGLFENLVKAFKRFASAHKYACEKRAAQWN